MYTDRLAVIDPTTPTVTIEFLGATYPAIRLDQGNSGSPLFLSQGLYRGDGVAGWAEGYYFSNYPVVFADGNPDDASAQPPVPSYATLGGIYIYGYSASDYAIREAGTVIDDYGAFYISGTSNRGLNAYIDGCYFGFRAYTFSGDPWGDPPSPLTQDFGIQVASQVLGVDFSGGTYSPVSLDATTTTTVDTGFSAGAGLVQDFVPYFVSPTLASTTSAQECMVWYTVGFDGSGSFSLGTANDRVLGFKIAADGTVTGGYTMFDTDDNPTNCDGVWAVCLGDGEYHVLRNMNGGITPTQQGAYTVCNEAGTYTNYRAGFDHADLPTYLHEIVYETNANYSFTSIHGTESGFLLSYKKLNVATWEPKYLLIAKDWTTFQFLVPSAQNTVAEEIVTQSEGGDNVASQVNMFLSGGVYYLIGGTTTIPKVATSGEPSGGSGGDGLSDESLRLRVWGYNLDGHSIAVFRVGPSESLIYDLTTGQFCNWASPGRDNWRAHVGQNWIGMSTTTFANNYGSDVVCGDDVSGVLYVLDPTYGLDDRTTTGSDTFNREVTGLITIDGREVLNCGAVTLAMSLGAPTQAGATITLSTSDDLGQTWTSHGSNTIVASEYSAVVEWRALGLGRAPARLFKFVDNGATTRIASADLR